MHTAAKSRNSIEVSRFSTTVAQTREQEEPLIRTDPYIASVDIHTYTIGQAIQASASTAASSTEATGRMFMVPNDPLTHRTVIRLAAHS